jgi:TPR repeat protein
MNTKRISPLYRHCWSVAGALFLVSALSATTPKSALDPLESARSSVRLKQFDRALTDLHKQAEGGNTEAQYLLGLALLNGLTSEPDLPQAKRWLKSAAQSNHAGAAFALAAALFRGDKSDLPEARDWLNRAARAGNLNAQQALKAGHMPLEPDRANAMQEQALRVALFFWSAQSNDSDLLRAMIRGIGVDASMYCWRRAPTSTLRIASV